MAMLRRFQSSQELGKEANNRNNNNNNNTKYYPTKSFSMRRMKDVTSDNRNILVNNTTNVKNKNISERRLGKRTKSLRSFWGKKKENTNSTNFTKHYKNEKINVDDLCLGDIRLSKLVENKSCAQSLLKFAQLQHCSENLLFWMVAEAFRLLFKFNIGVELVSHARKIYNQYLCDDAPKWVCVDPEFVREIHSTLSNRPQDIKPTIFEKAQTQTLDTLEKDCLPRYIKFVLTDGKMSGIEIRPEVKQIVFQAIQES